MSKTNQEEGLQTSNCLFTEDDICGYSMDLAESVEDPAMKKHIQACSKCQAILDGFLRVADAGKNLKFNSSVVSQSTSSSVLAGAALNNLGSSVKLIGDYEIIKKLGEGGMGAVFLARQKALDRQVALKVISPSLANKPDFIARFQREARATGNLNHPHIVQGIDVGRDEKTGLWHFAMEFVNGQSVGSLIKRGPIPEDEALKTVLQIAQALDFAHKRGFVHRDIKPDNILLTVKGDAKLADLGLAKHVDNADASLTQTGMMVGSPHYISPEQARGDATLDIRSDIYSLGITLFHMVTGETPFNGPTAAVIISQHLHDDVPDARKVNPKISDAGSRLITRMTRRDRNQRFKTPAELAEKIERILSGQDTAGVSEPIGARPARATGEVHGASARATAKPRDKKQGSSLVFAGVGTGVMMLGLVAWAVLGQNAPVQPGSVADKRVAEIRPEPAKPIPLPDTPARALPPADPKPTVDLATIEKRRDDESAAAQRFAADADALAAQGKFDSAIAVWENMPANQAALLKPRAMEAISKLQNQAEGRLKSVLDDAGKGVEEKRWADVKKVLDAATSLEYRAGIARLQELRGRLAAGEQADAARNAADTVFRHYGNAFADATAKGDYKAARKLAADAEADGALKELASKTSLAEVCDALDRMDAARTAVMEKLKDGQEHTFETIKGLRKGVVLKVSAEEIALEIKAGNTAGAQSIRMSELKEAERKRLVGDFKPQSAAEHLAQAIRALATDDSATAGVELTSAREHPLARFYQPQLDQKLLGATEAMAKTAWESIERDAGTGKLPDAKARELWDRLEAFEKEHGKSRFAATIKEKLSALQDRLWSQVQQLTLDLGGGVKLELVLIRPGKFMMGSPATEAKRGEAETQHQVTLTQPFYMGKYPITQEQYFQLMAKNPSTVKSPRNPVDLISWNDAQEFCAKLSKKIDRTAKLPTEAQWEYACRAGSTSAYYFGDAERDLGDYCWFVNNSDDKPTPVGGKKVTFANKMTHPVGLKKPNAWGLYDMHGNVCQWCEDWMEKFNDQAVVDATGPAQGTQRVMRGGSCNLSATDCRAASRYSYTPDRVSGHVGGFGLRVVIVKN